MSAGLSNTPKRSGSKAKGAVRAKSGCYTCRIRRKKCDEKPGADGSCQTCARLRLQCLGFGAKRPDWMREGNSVAEMREKIKTFLASNGMIKGHSASASLRPTTQTLSPPGATTSLSTAVASTSIAPRPLLHDASGHDTAGLDTPLSATSTLTPEGRSASPPSPPSPPSPSSSHDSLGPYANNRSFPPGYIDTSTRTRYDHTMSGSASGMHQEQPSSSASGVLHLSNGRPIGPPRAHSHSSTSRHLRRPHGSGLNGANSGYGLGLVDDSMDQLNNGGNGTTNSNSNSNTRCGPPIYSIASRSTTVPAYLPASSISDTSVPSRFPTRPSATSSHGPSHLVYSCPRTCLAMNSTSNTPNVCSPTSGSASSTSSSPAMRSNITPFTPYTPLPPLPLLPPTDNKPSVDMDWTPTSYAFVSSPMALPPTGLATLSPHSDTDFGFDPGMHWTSGCPSTLTDIDGSNNGTHLDASNVRVKTEPDTVGLDFNNNRTADDSSVLAYNSYDNDNVSLRPRSSTDDDCATPVPNAFNESSPAFANNNFLAGSSAYNNNNDINAYWTGPSPANPTPSYGFAASTSMAAREHAMYPVHAATGDSHYRHEPELSPDSPTPHHRDDPMIGPYAPTPHVGGQGHGAGSGYVSISHPPPGPYSLSAAHMRHGGSVQGELSAIGQGYGPSHGYGHTQPTSSWTGDDNMRPTNYQQGQSQFLQQQQPTQAQVQPQALYEWTHSNHSNDSATLQFPNASPTVRRTDLPPPSVQSSFGPLYTAPVDVFATDEMDAFAVQQAPLNTMTINGVDEGALMPYGTHVSAPINGMDIFGVPQEQQEQGYQYTFPQAAPIDPIYIGRGDGPLVEHYLLYVRPMQYFFLDERVVELLRILAFSNEAVRNSICSVASVHKRRMREGSVTLGGSSPIHAPFAITDGTPDAPEGDDDNTYYNRLRLALKTDTLTKAEAMAGLQCISSFLFAGGVGRWDFFLDVACRWVENVVGSFCMTRDVSLLGALTEMKRRDELESFIVRATMWFEVLASVSMVRGPKFLEVYRVLFGATDGARIVEIDGEAAHPPEAEFSMLEVMGCDNLTFLALAEISALAAWKEEEEQKQTLSTVELVRRGFAIEQRCLRAIADTRTTWRQDGSAPEDSLENRRRLTADIFRASARLYLQTVLSGDKPSVREVREGVLETIEALNRVPHEPASLRRSVVRSVVFPICLAGCMTDDESERATVLQFLQSEGGAGNCGSVVAVMETVWERRDAKQRRGKGGRRSAEHVADVSWREVLRECGGGVPILLV